MKYVGENSLTKLLTLIKGVTDSKITNPSGGTSGQVLTKTASGESWNDVDALPAVTSSDNGDVLQVINGAWAKNTTEVANLVDLPDVPSIASTSSLLKGDGNGNAVAATAGTDYLAANQNGTLTGNSSDTPLYLKSQSASTYLGFKNSSGTTLGYYGVNSSKKPVFYDNGDNELAYASHTQAASTITAGTFGGQVVAQNNTNYTTKQLRNVIISTEDPSGGSNGDIWIKYTN